MTLRRILELMWSLTQILVLAVIITGFAAVTWRICRFVWSLIVT